MAVRIIETSQRLPPRLTRKSSTRYKSSPKRKIKDPAPIAPFQHICEGQEFIVDMESLYKRQSLHSFDYLARATSEQRRILEMPIRIIDSNQRLLPRSKVGKFAALEEIQETMKALAGLPEGKSIQIDIDKQRYDILKKDGCQDPARSIVNVLRRKFLDGALPFKAYASDDKTITVIKEIVAPSKKKK